MKKRKKYNIIIVSILVILLCSLIGYSYYIEQINQKGFVFGNELQQIQEEVKEIQTKFYSKLTQWEEGDISKEELIEYLEEHTVKFEDIIEKYDSLTPPDPYKPALDLFRLSSQSQLESDREYIKWLKSGEESARIRSDLQLKESYEYEMAALAEFNAVKSGQKP